MVVRSRVTRVPKEVLDEVRMIKKSSKIKTNTDGFRRLLAYSQLGREVATKDMLTANAMIFNIKTGRTNLKIKKYKDSRYSY